MAIYLLLVMLYFSVPAHAKYSGGTGEPDDPYQIATVEDLMLLGKSPADYDKNFILTSDIDLDPNLPGRKVFDKAVIAPHKYMEPFWPPQGTPFTGTFDGNGNTISHLTIDGESYLGLFGRLEFGAEVRNLGIIDVSITGSGKYIGGLVGSNSGDLTACYSVGAVSGGEYVGGLMGWNSSGIVTHSYSTAVVDGSSYLGGLAGYNMSHWVLNCYSTGAVSGNEYVGGLVGRSRGNIIASYSTGVIIGEVSVGGLVGNNLGHIFASYSISAVIGKGSVGGLVGWNGDRISTSYTTGRVSGNQNVGGLVGCGRASDVSNSLWDIEASGQTTSVGGTGKTTAEMQTARTFIDAGWDFVGEMENGTYDIWWIDEGQDYPRLREFSEGLQLQPFPAFCPYPPDGAIDINKRSLILIWAPGGPTLHHDVYFGEDEEAVANATTESPDIYFGRKAPAHTACVMGTLEWDKTYYWRINEVKETDPDSSWKGPVWSFTTGDFIVVDDFESYNDLDLDHYCGRIYCAWRDGWEDPNNGSIVGYFDAPFTEQTIVHSGRQSMPLFYDNSGPALYSEATLTLTDRRDWTEEGVKVLTLWFHGDPNNAAEPMYVAIANRDGPQVAIYHYNPDAILIDEWMEWNIDLQEFADQGVDLTNINSITLGFGNRISPVAGGSGLVFFDDIQLYRPIPEPAQ